MPKKSSNASSSAAKNSSPANKKKQLPARKTRQSPVKPAPAKPKAVSHTDDGTPVVNATMAQIRKGFSGKSAQQLVRIPQVAERSKFYSEAAEVIGERESLALPYHGGRMWRCEVRVSDGCGAYGDNIKRRGKGGGVGKNNDGDFDAEGGPKKKSNYKSLTPLFRWYRGNLILATLPYILEDIVEVDAKLGTGKKRWANGMSDDEGLDSSDEEWDDEKYQVEPVKKMTMEISALTASAYEDSSHPIPNVGRSWISPDLQRFQSRKSALEHAEELVRRDLLIDRTLYGYGHNGVRLRPVKPTRKQALEAGMARFVRDGLWVVGQEEMWIEKRRDVLVKKMEKRLLMTEQSQGDDHAAAGEQNLKDDEKTNVEDVGNSRADAAAGLNEDVEALSCEQMVGSENWTARAAAGYVHPVLDAPVNSQNADPKPSAATVSPAESDESTTEGASKNPEINPNVADSSEQPQEALVKRGARPPPAFTPSTHYRLNHDQIDLCYGACIDHYESVMRTVRARSLHHELSAGFDVLRERGRGRYDMELPRFDSKEFSFLTDPGKAAWMPIVHTILGEDALLVHKGCFLSLPGSETQVYHQDGVHLNKKVHKPCYAINVFIPLVDYDMTNGPTEFCLGSHYLGHENFVKENVYTPCVTAGTPVIFDYRLGHRGLKNFSQCVRPVVYLTYSSVASGKEFRDSVNFSRKRYRKLGDFAEKPLSREERAKKRRMGN